MNKIKIVDDIIDQIKIDDSIEYSIIPKGELFIDVTTINITVLKDTKLLLEYSTRKAVKLDITITTLPNVNFELSEYRYGKNFKVRYRYFLDKNSNIDVNKFYDVSGINEMDMINLNGENANINYNFKTISTGFEKYNMTIYHNAMNTNSCIRNNGVNINKGSLQFNVSSFGILGNNNCNINQQSRIVNLTKNKCQINPNLFIDEYDVSANHSALIGRFSDEELFYLMSRGIDEKSAIKLLINGFLVGRMPKELEKRITKNINKYWR